MGTDDNVVGALEDLRVNVKNRLSALWVTQMFLCVFADILGFYSPGIIEAVTSGELGAVRISAGFLLVVVIRMAVPSILVFLSLPLPAYAGLRPRLSTVADCFSY